MGPEGWSATMAEAGGIMHTLPLHSATGHSA